MESESFRSPRADEYPTGLPVCYRHPDRETRLACTRCDRPVCVDCVHPAAVGQLCPDCAAASRRQAQVVGAYGRTPVVTYGLLAASAGVFLLAFLIPGFDREVFIFGAQANQLIAAGEWYRLLTAPFLHAGIMHLLFNMWALYVFGPQLERRVGSWAFAAMYVAAGLAGGVAYFLSGSPQPAVGASGAIFGLFGAWLVAAYRNRNRRGGRESFRQLAVLLGINLALPLLFPNIAWQAHVGGLIAGGLIAALWQMSSLRGAGKEALRAAVGLAVAALALVAVLV